MAKRSFLLYEQAAHDRLYYDGSWNPEEYRVKKVDKIRADIIGLVEVVEDGDMRKVADEVFPDTAIARSRIANTFGIKRSEFTYTSPAVKASEWLLELYRAQEGLEGFLEATASGRLFDWDVHSAGFHSAAALSRANQSIGQCFGLDPVLAHRLRLEELAARHTPAAGASI